MKSKVYDLSEHRLKPLIFVDIGQMKRLTLLFLLIHPTLWAQPINPGVDVVFRPDELAVIRLTMSPEDKAFLLHPDNVESEVYLEAVFHMVNSQMDTVLAQKVGVRLRGNTSRYHEKKPFKIDFREFGGKKFFDYKKFNLKPNVNDPSHFREPLSLLCFREMDIPAARTFPLRLYINDEYMGVYTNVEQIDDEFLNDRFGHEEGFLYKCNFGANLLNNEQIYNELLFESEINEDEDTRAELAHFVDVLNTTSTTNFATEIEKVFNVDRYLRQLAVEALIGHWDGYSYNMNNYYLFYNGVEKKFEYFPYDTDNTWGIDWANRDWATRNLNAWSKEEVPLPLTKRILNVPTFKQKYVQYLGETMKKVFNEEFVLPKLEAYKNLLSDAVQEDIYFSKSFGFTHADFLQSFSTGMANHVEYGIAEFLDVRRRHAIQQIPELSDKDDLTISVYPNPASRPEFYYYTPSGLLKQAHVYSSTGTMLGVSVERLPDDRIRIALPDHAPSGLYVVHVDGKVFRWMYAAN